MPPYDCANGGSADFFGGYGMVFITVGVGVILGHWCGIQGRNYAKLIQGREMAARCDCRNWILCA